MVSPTSHQSSTDQNTQESAQLNFHCGVVSSIVASLFVGYVHVQIGDARMRIARMWVGLVIGLAGQYGIYVHVISQISFLHIFKFSTTVRYLAIKADVSTSI